MKKCPNCDIEKEDDEFYKFYRNKKRTRFNLGTYCKECSLKINKKWREENSEKLKIKRKEYREKQNLRLNVKPIFGFWSTEKEEFKKRQSCRHKAILLRKKGILKRLDFCQICGKYEEKTDMHHSNYERPDLVIFLCRPCHLKLHWNILGKNK